MKLEQVVEALNRCLQDPSIGTCAGCPYEGVGDTFATCCLALMYDCLDLLKAQEPKVMTLEEYDEWANIPFTERDPVFLEQKLRRGIITWWTNTTECCRKEYGKRERCWTSRPTDEQRRATPWE